MPGDHLGPAADHHLIDVAPDEHLTVAVGHGHGIVVAAVTHQRQRTRPSRALIAGIIGSRRQWQENLTIPLETLADGLLVAPQPRRLAPAALFGESIVEGREALGTRDGDQEVPPDEADQSLDLALVVALARPAEPVLEQIVGLKLREDARSLPLPIAQDPGNRQLGVVVQDGSGDAAEEGKRRVVAIAECFGRLRRIGRNKATITVGTLTALRRFRDGYMMKTPKRRALVAEYYELAPRIVAAIPQGHSDWDWIGGRIDAAIAAIAAGDEDGAFAIYAAMARRLAACWMEPEGRMAVGANTNTNTGA